MRNKTNVCLMLIILVLSMISAGCLQNESQKAASGVIITPYTDWINRTKYITIYNTNDFPVMITAKRTDTSITTLWKTEIKSKEIIKGEYFSGVIDYSITKNGAEIGLIHIST